MNKLDFKRLGEEAISVSEAAEILGVSRTAILKMIYNKRLWYAIKIGKTYILSRTEVKEIAEERRDHGSWN